MASSSKYKGPYDVFLSFRGELRNNFVGHLYNALVQNGIHTFRDSEELRKGDDISMLMNAIKGSCFAIIVFSENFASSTWCLKEVAKIMECKEQKGLEVRPVFYKVDPREVREGRKSYARALTKHKSKFKKEKEMVERWKKALFDAGSLSGWPLNDGDDESKLIQRIVREISTHLSRTPLDVADHPVGLASRVAELKSMLNLESKDDVLMVGLWGQGGIGKTTLGRAIYNDISEQFVGSSFLANVRENSKDCKGLVTLQEKLLNDILLPQERLVVSYVDGGINLIQQRLCHKRVLLILDDVDHLCQLRALAGKASWFGNGSRILVTTRDSHLLTCQEIDQDYVYEVKALDDSEAHELLSKHAFLTHQKFKIRTDLVGGVLDHAKGLPLALEVLGCFLRGRGEDEWESTLDKISTTPNKGINDVLKISYHGLETNEKDIFLHIACFFKGWETEYIMKVFDSCDFKATIGLRVLAERSLIRIESGILQMHDLIQLMGMDIVNQECDDPGRRSRLWLYNDFLEVLSSDMGDCAVKAIVLELPEPTETCISPDAFAKMRGLRLLILRNVHDSFQGPINLPNGLRWFEWPGCARRIPEFSAAPKKLVGLDMRGGNITGVVKQFKDFQHLKYIDFSECELLVSMPDLSCTPNLEELYLQDCNNLVEAHESIAYHDKLQVLNLSGCSQLSIFPNVLKSKNLQTLEFADCKIFERFPDIPHKLESLELLCLQGTAIKELPASIENLVSLKSMNLCSCKNLVSLPSSIYKLQNLRRLELRDCTTFIRFPKYENSADPSMNMGRSSLQHLDLQRCNLFEVEFLDNLFCFPVLRYLWLSGNNITSLPTSINKRHHLSTLDVTDCYQLQEIPQLPPCLKYVYAENCRSLQNTGDLISPHDFIHRELSMIQKLPPGLNNCESSFDLLSEGFPSEFAYSIVLPGGEMPEGLQPIEHESVSFMASKDLYNKFLGLAIYVVIGVGDEIKDQYVYDTRSYVNGQRREGNLWMLNSMDSDHITLQLYTPSQIFGVVDFGQVDGSHVQFRLTVSRENMKKWGIQIICKPLEDNLKVRIQENKLMDLALLYEVGHDTIDSEAESSHKHEDSPIEVDLRKDSQDCQMSTEEHSQIGTKRKHEFIFPLGKRIKTMWTSIFDRWRRER